MWSSVIQPFLALGLFSISLLLLSGPNSWGACPVGDLARLSNENVPLTFDWAQGSGAPKKCTITNTNALKTYPAKIVGCLANEHGEEQFLLEPSATLPNNCTSAPITRLYLPTTHFLVEANDLAKRTFQKGKNPPPESRALKMEAKPTRPSPSSENPSLPQRTNFSGPEDRREAYYRGDGIGTLLDDVRFQGRNIKSSQDVDKYHMCLLTKEKAERPFAEKYYKEYRALISYASVNFGVPNSILSCTCGRESRFNGKLKDRLGAAGVCQATGDFLDEVNRFIAKPGEMRDAWKSYMASIENRLESPECKNTPITKEMILKCPSLGIGTTSLYLRHIFSRLEGRTNNKMNEEDWNKQTLESLIAVSGAYNVGVTFADNVLGNVLDRRQWPRTLLQKTCESWLVRSTDPGQRKLQIDRAKDKFAELKGHLLALRNCLKKDVAIGHQGELLGGDCAPRNPEKQVRDQETFLNSLPKKCEEGRTQMATSEEAVSPGGTDGG